jgi:hypothetical protein
MSSTAIERLRQRYRPSDVRLLFVGESAPAGGTFFYAANSTLYFETRTAFARALPDQLSGLRFLDLFKTYGCYLDDLCLEPINKLPQTARRQKRIDAEASLGERLRRYDPQMAVAIGKTTAAPHVRTALDRAGLTETPLGIVAFPGRPEHKVMFHTEMDAILRSARAAGLLHA